MNLKRHESMISIVEPETRVARKVREKMAFIIKKKRYKFQVRWRNIVQILVLLLFVNKILTRSI